MARVWLLVASAAAQLYLLGAMLLMHRAVYAPFAALSREAFAQAYSGFGARIGAVYVAPEFIAFGLPLALFVWAPPALPRWVAWAAALLGAAYFAITFAWHLPVHRALASGDNSPAVIEALLRSHGARTLVHAARTALLTWAVVAARAV
ncbi:MAG: hypothetical protein U0269_06075 [Polyangiales bacterium]